MIPLSDLCVALKQPPASEYGFILDLRAAAVAHIQKLTDRYFGAAGSYTEIIPGPGLPRMWLREPAASLPTTLLERAGPGEDDVTVTASATDGYVLRHNGLALIRKGGLCWLDGYEYEVTYTRGYAVTDSGEDEESIAAPDDVRKAVYDLVTWWFENRIPAALGTVAPEVDNHLSAVLAPWIRRRWA